MTISEFIDHISKCNLALELKYVHPTLFIVYVSQEFHDLDEDSRTQLFSKLAKISPSALSDFRANPMIELLLITDEERKKEFDYLDMANAGHHWLGAFSSQMENKRVSNGNSTSSRNNDVRAIHFYGYKGGQGRSTVLLCLAKTLADAGYKVLAVDADIEAPSLDAMFDVAASDVDATLMGLVDPNGVIAPLQKTYVGKSVAGQVDLISARPVKSAYDLDFAAFLLHLSLDAKLLELAISRLRDYVLSDKNDRYDIVLFDHRTGLAPSILPIMEAWPGPAVIFVRPDGMARHIQDSHLLDALLAHDPESPGAFVSFSLDPKKTAESARDDHGPFIESLLEKIADAMNLSNDIDPSELERYWVFWRHDQNLVDGAKFSPSDMSNTNRDAISQLRSVLGLSENQTWAKPSKNISLTSSGSSDEGHFILTPDLARLFSVDSPYIYIFGRKGTGKTRLLTELVRQNLGEPLLVANDSEVGGLKSASPLFNSLLAEGKRNFESFWWKLLDTALSVDTTKDDHLSQALASQLQMAGDDPHAVMTRIMDKATKSSNGLRRIFLIDGVETAVPASDLRDFVEALFRFLAAVQFDKSLSKFITIRLFLRTDLSNGAAQNVEQQIEGTSVYLHWNKTAILNFALARILSLPWFTAQFPAVCEQIEKKLDDISRGALPDELAESLLLQIFPQGLERNKVKTTTFFASYFSDAGGDKRSDAAFYPRLFDGFLRTLAENCAKNSSMQMPDGRLPSVAVLTAYDQASRTFIEEVRTELYAFLNLEQDTAQNKDAVDRLIGAFNGEQTPFSVEGIIPILASKSNIAIDKVRQALASMQKIGMFEPRPGFAGDLRAGRLYKAGLNMKYVRTNRKASL